MKIKDQHWWPFVPEWNNNWSLPENEQISLEVHPLSNEELTDYSDRIERKQKRGYRNVETSNAQKVIKQQFVQNVRNLKNFWIGDDEITNPEDFVKRAPSDLVQEIIFAIEDITILEENEKKRAGSGSKSSAANLQTEPVGTPTTTAQIVPTNSESRETAKVSMNS